MMMAVELTLSHVAVPAPDIQASARFYALLGAQPGFHRTSADGRVVLAQLHLGHTFVELLADAPPAGGGHLALSTTDIEAVWLRLEENGYRPLARPARGQSGVMWFFVLDPAGNAVEITMPVAQQ